ncbi:MAG: glutamate 5-kinase [Bacteroides sp.]|nr:glutamate 5-kinase [Roseburia sp.]MCM1345727.1 glutamate 5-kinase [Bacteroides sp.]MCM1419828.1 glutamate 5-kinase [Bacteroides sp.]
MIKKITIKIGSNVLTRKDGSLNVTRMSALVDQIAELKHSGIEVVLVSSGAVASGRSELGKRGKTDNHRKSSKKLDSVDQRQLYSAVGQAKLINRYFELFRDHGITVGQVLTTKESLGTRQHYLNQRNCINVMLQCDVLPIVNENDTISVTELMFTDNDELSGLVATMTDSDILIILSNIDGIYTGSPSDTHSQIIRKVDKEQDISSYIQTEKSGFGRGGMQTKSKIACKVAEEGVAVIIANGKKENILTDLIAQIQKEPENIHCIAEGDTPCTLFVPSTSEMSSIKKWIAHSEGFAKGAIHLNEGASAMMQEEKAISILPIGVTQVDGEFEYHDIISIIDNHGNTIGVGRSDYSSEEARMVAGKRNQKPIIHYDYLYLE